MPVDKSLIEDKPEDSFAVYLFKKGITPHVGGFPNWLCRLEQTDWGYDCPRCGYAITNAAAKKLGEPKCPLGRMNPSAK